MQQIKRTHISLASSFAYLLLAILVSNVFIQSLQTVYAQAGLTKITGFSHNLLTTGYSSGKIWALATNGTQGTTANNWLYEVSALNQTVDAIYNVTRSTGASAKDMWCSPQYCYITDGAGATAFISAVATLTVGSETKGNIEYTVNVRESGADSAGAINGRFSTAGQFSELYVITYDATIANDRDLRVVNSVPNFGTPTTIDSGFTANPQGNIYSMLDETRADRRVFLVVNQNLLTVTSLAGPSGLCDFGIAIAVNAGKIFTVVAPDGTSWTGGDPDLQEIYINGEDLTGGIRIVKDTGNWLNCPTDTTNYTLDNTVINLGSTTTLNGIILENHGIAVIQESGTSARLSIMEYNEDSTITDPTTRFSDSLLIVNTNPVDSQVITGTPANNQINYNQDTGHIFWAETGAGRAVVMYDVSSFEPPTPPPTPETPVLPENNVAELTGFIFCIGGIIPPASCDSDTGFPLNTDPKTNGSGIAVMAFAIIVSYAFIVSIHFGAQRQLANKNVQLVEVMTINPVLLLVMLIVDVGLVWYFGFIEDIIFYGVMVLLLGLAGFGIYRQAKP